MGAHRKTTASFTPSANSTGGTERRENTRRNRAFPKLNPMYNVPRNRAGWPVQREIPHEAFSCTVRARHRDHVARRLPVVHFASSATNRNLSRTQDHHSRVQHS